jgi:hypothetical protein
MYAKFYYSFIDKNTNRLDFELLEIDTDSKNYIFLEDSFEKIIKPEIRN